ncbi:MAG TPA: PTS sugar transporter subunit IIA [Dermatophilaceae bacterium]|jgi:lichenan operon transcriptional antiterminator
MGRSSLASAHGEAGRIERQRRLLQILTRAEDWVSARDIATRLAVSDRSVRTYIRTVNSEAVTGKDVIESSALGYRLAVGAAPDPGSTGRTSVDARRDTILFRLLERTEGWDLYDLAQDLYVSESTVESDLVELKDRADQCGLVLRRAHDVISLTGTESARRRAIRAVIRHDSQRRMDVLPLIQQRFPEFGFEDFVTELTQYFGDLGYGINDYGLDATLLHIAVTVSRSTGPERRAPAAPMRGRTAEGETPYDDPLVGPVGEMIHAHFSVRLAETDLRTLSEQISARVLTEPSGSEPDDDASGNDLTNRIVDLLGQEYGIQLYDKRLVKRFGVHLGNLVRRGREGTFNPNPLTSSIKHTSPLIYELAVFVAQELGRQCQLVVPEDEIAFIAFHIGGTIHSQAQQDDLVRTLVVTRNYHDMHQDLATALAQALPTEIRVSAATTGSNLARSLSGTELVVSTEDLQLEIPTVRVSPWPTRRDVEVVRQAAAKARHQRQQPGPHSTVLSFFEPQLFFRNPPRAARSDAHSAIRYLGAAMVKAGVFAQDEILRAIEREDLSSTAFIDGLAVPHPIGMRANRSALAVMVLDEPINWSGRFVNVVVMLALSPVDRSSFRVAFESIIEVLDSPRSLARLVAGSHTFEEFVATFAQLFAR